MASESESSCVKRGGEYSVRTLRKPDGSSLDLLERDCGDYIEVTPLVTFVDNSLFRCRVVDSPLQLKEVVVVVLSRYPDTYEFSYPGVSIKMPKNLPQDPTERAKVFNQIRDEFVLKQASYCVESVNKVKAMSGDIDQLLDMNQAKMMYDQIKKSLNLD